MPQKPTRYHHSRMREEIVQALEEARLREAAPPHGRYVSFREIGSHIRGQGSDHSVVKRIRDFENNIGIEAIVDAYAQALGIESWTIYQTAAQAVETDPGGDEFGVRYWQARTELDKHEAHFHGRKMQDGREHPKPKRKPAPRVKAKARPKGRASRRTPTE